MSDLTPEQQFVLRQALVCLIARTKRFLADVPPGEPYSPLRDMHNKTIETALQLERMLRRPNGE